MSTRPLKTSMEQIVRGLILHFQAANFGAKAKYIYLPLDLYDNFTDYIEEQLVRMCDLTGMPAPNLDEAFRYFYLGVEVLSARTDDIIVTDELLP